jgi:hypothetical protein
VEITYWDKERLKIAVNMPASCSAHALRMHPGILSGPVALLVDLIKDPSHIGFGERDHPVLWIGDGSHTWLENIFL